MQIFQQHTIQYNDALHILLQITIIVVIIIHQVMPYYDILYLVIV